MENIVFRVLFIYIYFYSRMGGRGLTRENILVIFDAGCGYQVACRLWSNGPWSKLISERWSNKFFHLSCAPKIGFVPQLGSEPRTFEIFARKWELNQFWSQFWSPPSDIGIKLYVFTTKHLFYQIR